MTQTLNPRSKTIEYIIRTMRKFGATSIEVNGHSYNLFDEHDLCALSGEEDRLHVFEEYLKTTEYMWSDPRIMLNARNIGVSPLSDEFKDFYRRHKAMESCYLPASAHNDKS